MICLLRCCELSFSGHVSGLTCGCNLLLLVLPGMWRSLKILSFKGNLLKRLSTDKGNCLMMEGLWFDCLCR